MAGFSMITPQHRQLLARWREIYEAVPPNVNELCALGESLLLVGDFDHALMMFRKASSASPRNVAARYGAAVALESKTQFHEAVREYQNTLRLEPTHQAAAIALQGVMEYFDALAQNRPYFGRVMDSDQNPENKRPPYMRGLIESECRNQGRAFFSVLEVGSWAGGSAIRWADGIASCHDRKGVVMCVDGWRPYHDPGTHATYGYGRMNEAARSGEIFRLFLHNIRAAGYEDMILPLRGSAEQVMPYLRDEQYHLIYVDGSHIYKDALHDIDHAIRLVADGGVIAGDDLEIQLRDLDPAFVQENIDYDLAVYPPTQTFCHPGVAKAVAERFGEALIYEGFWAVRRVGNRWEPVEITPISEA